MLSFKETDLKSRFVLTNYYFTEGLAWSAERLDIASPVPCGIGPDGMLVSGNTQRFFDRAEAWAGKNFFRPLNRLFLRMWREMARFNRPVFAGAADFLSRYGEHERNVALMHVLDWSAMRVAEKNGFFGLSEPDFLLAANPPVSLVSQERVRAHRLTRAGATDHSLLEFFGWQYPESMLKGDPGKVKESALPPEIVSENARRNQEFFDSLGLPGRVRAFFENMRMLRYIDSGYHKHALSGRIYSARVRQEIGRAVGLPAGKVLYLTPEEILSKRLPPDLDDRIKGDYFVMLLDEGASPLVRVRRGKA